MATMGKLISLSALLEVVLLWRISPDLRPISRPASRRYRTTCRLPVFLRVRLLRGVRRRPGSTSKRRRNFTTKWASADGLVASRGASLQLSTEHHGQVVMKFRTALTGMLAASAASLAVAQTTPPSDPTAPSAASSPSQRETTSSHAVEAPTPNGTAPASASSPHQQQVTSGAQSSGSTPSEKKQAMKDCMAAQKAKNSGMSKSEMKSTCRNQLKANSQK